MATTTTNLALIKPAGTDKIRIAQINSNMDVLDAKIGPVGNTSLQEQLNNKQGTLTFDSAPTSGSGNPVTSGGVYRSEQSVRNTVSIVATGNTAPKAITVGEFVQWQGAIYAATANIPSGGTLSTSNLKAVPNGGLNALKSSVDSLNSSLNNKVKDIKAVHFYNPYDQKTGIITFPLDAWGFKNALILIGNRLYSVMVHENGTAIYELYALDIRTGQTSEDFTFDGLSVKFPVAKYDALTIIGGIESFAVSQ